MEKKYEFAGETKKVDGHVVHRIRAIRNFGEVKSGDLGGWIEKEDNLSHNGSCWVDHEACVYGYAIVEEDAKIVAYAVVFEHALINNYALIGDRAVVRGLTSIGGTCIVGGSSVIDSNIRIDGHAIIFGREFSFN